MLFSVLLLPLLALTVQTGVLKRSEDEEGLPSLYLALEEDDIELSLVSHGADPSGRVSLAGCDSSLLHLAIDRDEGRVARQLISFGADVYAKNCRNATIMEYAIAAPSVGVIRALVSARYDANWRPEGSDLPLIFAVRNQSAQETSTLLEIVSLLLESGARMDLADDQGNTALILAAQRGYAAIVSALLNQGATMDHANKEGETAISLAVKNGFFKIASVLIQNKANLNYIFPNGDTYMHKAARSGELGGVLFFLDAGINPDVLNNNEETPLYISVFNNNQDISNTLLVHGADTNKTVDGKTYVFVAVEQNSASALASLLTHGANVDDKGSYSITPLLYASQAGRTELVQLLLRGGANVAVRDEGNWNFTPLHWPAVSGDLEMARLLVDSGADIGARDVNGYTPLHDAAAYGRTEVVRLLLDRGAEINSMNNDGNTPLALALLHDHQETADFISSRGGTK